MDKTHFTPDQFLPRTMPYPLRRKMERAFDADFSNVRLFESTLALRLGALAYAAGEHIVFAPGAYRPDDSRGRELLGHELAHIIQQRQRRVASRHPFAINCDPDLEEEACWAGRRVVRGLSARLGRAGRDSHAEGQAPLVIQRLIINVGDTPLHEEYRKANGWIVAKDIFVAMSDMAVTPQKIIELNGCSGAITLGTSENIYLQGHGSPGAVAATYGVGLIAKQINKLTFPADYKGKIRAYSCSAGAADKLSFSILKEGVAELAAQVKVPGITVSGAAGIALNCAYYASGSRANKSDDASQTHCFAEIARTRGPVDLAWKAWVDRHIPPYFPAGIEPSGALGLISEDTLKRGAVKAHLISKDFYMALQTACFNDLIDSGADLTTKHTGGGGRPRARSV
jgi:hypothetical protein